MLDRLSWLSRLGFWNWGEFLDCWDMGLTTVDNFLTVKNCGEFFNCRDMIFETVKIKTLDQDHVKNWDFSLKVSILDMVSIHRLDQGSQTQTGWRAALDIFKSPRAALYSKIVSRATNKQSFGKIFFNRNNTSENLKKNVKTSYLRTKDWKNELFP